MEPRVRVIGESLLDVVRGDGPERRHPGGSPMNVAFGLARLGVETHLLTHLADDAAGRLIVEHLRGAGVTLDPASFGAAATSSAVARIGADGSAEYDFAIEWSLAPPAHDAPAPWTHIGSIGAALPPGAEQLEELLPSIRGDGILSFDPNIRPALMPERPAALARFARLSAASDVVKLSDEDAAWLFPGEPEDAVLDSLLQSGCRVAVVTRGADGVRLAGPAGRVFLAARSTQVVDTIGAGDSFMSALIAFLLDAGLGLDPEGLMRAGTTAATAAMITVSRAGAQPPTAAELRAALT